MGTPVKDAAIRIPEQTGEGFMKSFSFNGIDALLYDLKLNHDMLLKREKDAPEFYTLNYDEMDDAAGIRLLIEGDVLATETHHKSFFYLTSFLYDIDSLLQKNVNLKGIRIFMPLHWMRQYLQISEKEDVLEQYIRLKAAGVWQKTIDAETRELTNELLADGTHNLLYYQNKMLRLVELFFDWLYHEMQIRSESKPLSRGDILTARRIETLLTEDVTVLPPTIKEMSRQFALSESKLKKVFKTVFGLPPYEYYQKHRMQKAKQLLTSGNYSIKDVGYTLGYSNLSNFTLAFKKEFGKLPSEVLREGR